MGALRGHSLYFLFIFSVNLILLFCKPNILQKNRVHQFFSNKKKTEIR